MLQAGLLARGSSVSPAFPVQWTSGIQGRLRRLQLRGQLWNRTQVLTTFPFHSLREHRKRDGCYIRVKVWQVESGGKVGMVWRWWRIVFAVMS
jgi:hypothetical protein